MYLLPGRYKLLRIYPMAGTVSATGEEQEVGHFEHGWLFIALQLGMGTHEPLAPPRGKVGWTNHVQAAIASRVHECSGPVMSRRVFLLCPQPLPLTGLPTLLAWWFRNPGGGRWPMIYLWLGPPLTLIFWVLTSCPSLHSPPSTAERTRIRSDRWTNLGGWREVFSLAKSES